MLVPTFYSKYAADSANHKMTTDEFAAINPVKGWGMSFCDAPGYYNDQTNKWVSPAVEELQEIQWAVPQPLTGLLSTTRSNLPYLPLAPKGING